MKTAAIGFALLALAAAPALPTGPTAEACSISCSEFDHYSRWTHRRDPAEARIAITTEGGEVTLLLTDRDVMFQLSERTLRRVDRKLRDAREDQDNPLADAIAAVVTGTVRELLDHGLACRVRDLRDVRYEDGRLVFIGRDGEEVFDDVDVCDEDLAQAFSERDARDFVREFRRLKRNN